MSARDHIDVSVLVPVLNEEADLRRAAEAMLAQEFDGELEFLFIDGGSSDASPAIQAELAAADSRVRLLSNPARTTPHALNLGLHAARGEYVARMDAHAAYPPGYLAAGVRRLRRGGAAWVSGPQIAVGTTPGSIRVARALSVPLGRGGARFREALEHEREVDTGFTGVWRRDLLLSHDGWDEGWINDQDVELAARIRRAGGRILCLPEMTADYVPRGTLRALARQYHTYGIYRVKTARRHPETLRRSQLLPPGITLAVAGTILAPGSRLRRAALAGSAGYVAVMLACGIGAGRRGQLSDVMALPAVWATMHLSYGAGFLRGCARFGPPWRAIAGAVGGSGFSGSGGGAGSAR